MHHLIRQMRNARKLKGISQKRLAAMAGVGQNSIIGVETYRHSPTLRYFERVLPHLGLTLTLTPTDTDTEGA